MKKILFLLLIFSNVHAQSLCVSADCMYSIRLPQDSVSLNGYVTANSPYTNVWRVISGSGNITGATSLKAMAHGLKTGMNIFQITAQTASATATVNDTVNILPPCPVADSAGIIAAYVKAHPCPVCPVCPPVIICPPPVKQRTANSLTWDAVNKRWVIGYDNGTTSTL